MKNNNCCCLLQGLQWCLLKEEEVVPRILAIEGRRSRLKNLDPAGSRRKSRAPDETEADAEVKLLRRLEAQGTKTRHKCILSFSEDVKLKQYKLE